MSAHDVIGLLLERGTAMQTFWGFYISISLGVLALIANAKGSARLPYLAALVSVGFVAFAWVNCDGITDIARQRQFFHSRLDQVPLTPCDSDGSGRAIAKAFQAVSEPPTPESVQVFHISADVGVMATMWFLVFRDRRSNADAV